MSNQEESKEGNKNNQEERNSLISWVGTKHAKTDEGGQRIQQQSYPRNHKQK
jgi:hypothetical protein